ncbi:MAG: amidohydrolase family protein [Acidimicrobiales bacterium]
MNDRLIIVSGDGHAAAPLEMYRPYLEAEYHEALDELIPEQDEYQKRIAGPAHPSPEAMAVFDDRGAMAAGGEAGSYDIGTRIAEMDAEGVTCDIVHSGTQTAPPLWYGAANRVHSAELQQAGVKAYHRWLIDFMDAADGRLAGVAEPGPTLDMAESVRDLHWLADRGFVSVGVPGQTYNQSLPPLWDEHYEPFWSACADLGLVLSVHAGWGSPQGAVYTFFDTMNERLGGTEGMGGELDRAKMEEVGMMLAQELAESADSPFRLNNGPQKVLWQLMLGGVFDRHPRLKLVLTEVRATWVPGTIAGLDRLAAETGSGLEMKPSEYFELNCAVAPSSTHRSEVEMRHQIGVHKMLFGTDYPHHEGTWPNTRAWIKVAFEGVPEDEARLILGENAISLYGLDRDRLAKIAERIGPWPSEVLVATHDVDQRLVDHFHKRAGFCRPADPVDFDVLGDAFRGDLALIGG